MNILFLMLLFSPFLVKAQDLGKGIHFEKDLSWDQVKEKAKSENRYIFIDVYATWCGPCKLMDSNVYPDEKVGQTMNDKFVSVKLQLDSTGMDNKQVKMWYPIGRELSKEYQINGLPSYLFFTPDGQLAYMDLGYQDVLKFIRLAKTALDPQTLLYYYQLDAYQKGKKDYTSMGGLALYVKNVVRNMTLAQEIASDYKENYLDKLSTQELLNQQYFNFIDGFSDLIHVNDHFFQLCYNQSDKVDELRNEKNWAMDHVKFAIVTDEIWGKIVVDGEPIYQTPDWDMFQTTLAQKYPKIDIKLLVLDVRISYYSSIKDWTQWAYCKNRKIKEYPPKAHEAYDELNDHGAWLGFLYSNNRRVLIMALHWAEMLLKTMNDVDGDRLAVMDTKANILYKLGHVRRALKTEEKVFDSSMVSYLHVEKRIDTVGTSEMVLHQLAYYYSIILEMRQGDPTYVDQGAIWAIKSDLVKHAK